jgi:hypothetical protein
LIACLTSWAIGTPVCSDFLSKAECCSSGIVRINLPISLSSDIALGQKNCRLNYGNKRNSYPGCLKRSYLQVPEDTYFWSALGGI